jgi:predicted nucleic acid-binding protein
VADINVLVRATERYGPSFRSLAVVAGSKRFGLWVSDHIIEGTADVLEDEYHVSHQEIQAYERLLVRIARERGAYIPEPTAQVTDCIDWEDNAILALAADADARLIVSNDHHLTEMHPWRGRAILTPGQFAEQAIRRQPELAGGRLERMEDELRARLPVAPRRGADRGIGD